MTDFLKHPWVFAVVASVLAAALAWAYERTLNNDQKQLKKTFFKTLFVSMISLSALTYWVTRPEPTLSEPFHAT